MPNWCEGYLKIRGKKEDIVNFVENEISLLKSKDIFSEPEYLEIKMIKGSYEYRFEHKNSYKEYLRLKNARRFFVESEEISFYYHKDEVCYLTLEIKQAWYIDVQELLMEHSKKYHVDFNIYASESGMKFEQYITVINGELVKNEEKEYTDFQFEAINPELGG